MPAERSVFVRVEVVYAQPDQQWSVELILEEPATVAQALDAALPKLPFDDWRGRAVGVYGQKCEPTTLLCDSDRVEVYRELVMDAKAARRERAEQQKKLNTDLARRPSTRSD